MSVREDAARGLVYIVGNGKKNKILTRQLVWRLPSEVNLP
jgi:hypothetical protein